MTTKIAGLRASKLYTEIVRMKTKIFVYNLREVYYTLTKIHRSYLPRLKFLFKLIEYLFKKKEKG